MNSGKQEQTVITLDSTNSVQFLIQYVELAQQKGAFLLQEAEILKRACDVLVNGAQDAEINGTNARQLLIQGIHKGQRHGSYTLNDAALLHKVIQLESTRTEVLSQQQTENQPLATDNDLSELADPIPLKPKEI